MLIHCSLLTVHSYSSSSYHYDYLHFFTHQIGSRNVTEKSGRNEIVVFWPISRFRNFQESRTRVQSRLGLVHNERRIARRFRFTHRPVPRYFSIQKVLRPDRVQVQVEQESGQVCVRSTCLSVRRELRVSCSSSIAFFPPSLIIPETFVDICQRYSETVETRSEQSATSIVDERTN